MADFAFIFPGQGSQFIGMGRALADNFLAAREVFEQVDDALSQDLSGLMWTGSEDDLKLTANTQPALMAVSVAAMAALAQEHNVSAESARFVAGHSLGEYSALCAAGAIGVADCAKLLRIRGEAMQAAVPAGEGAMAALLGASLELAESLCQAGEAAGGTCEVANDNAPGQVVISGSRAAVELAMAQAEEEGVKKAVALPVSAPFHCALMQPAAEAMEQALAEAHVSAPVTPVIANVTAAPVTDPDAIRAQLVAQVTGRVRWRESVIAMHGAGVTRMAEAGAGKVLTVMNRRTLKEIEGVTLGTPEELAAFAKTVKG